ncbi:MAG: D-glycero-beta-D-manno-heptose 1-phosphate adenylyltransferase, partial [Candidatus Margulisiibacteriota bacterium]
GGCGNVAANIKTLGGVPLLVSTLGTDSSGAKLLNALKNQGISTQHIFVEPSRPTILKSRIIAHSQHLVRVDRESKAAIDKTLQGRVWAALKKLVLQCDAVVISDYGKGMVTAELSKALIKLARQHQKPIAVDPKGTDYQKYHLATIITPNLKEAQEATKIFKNDAPSILRMGSRLLKNCQTQYILITRGAYGMSLFTAGEKPHHIPAAPKEVYDITGAGDTVIATLTLGLSAQAEIVDAVLLANFAASVAVSKVGTAPVLAEELLERLEDKGHISQKIRNRRELKNIVDKLKNAGKKVVFTNGCFDILHQGHVRYLKAAKSQGDILVVGLNSDFSVKKIKGNGRPYTPELERAEILAALECVDYVTIFNEATPIPLLELLQPDLHVKGGDYKAGNLPEAKVVKKFGGKVVIIPFIKGKSTTGLIDKIRKQGKENHG